MTEPSPLETALDLFVYIPVGFALTVGEEVPKLAAKGRARLGGRIAAARMIGQFAVAQGRKEVDRRLGGDAPTAAPRPPTSPPPTSRPPTSRPPAPRPSPAPRGAARPGGTDTTTVGPLRAERAPEPADATPHIPTPAPPTPVAADAPDVATLAIPGYDSLSASQVVQRLAGLSGPELEAVRRYESSSRGRRTILARVTQLQTR